MKLTAILTLWVAALTGCSVIPAGFESFQPVSNASSFELPNGLVAKQGDLEYALAPGRYVAAGENQVGTLYRGPTRCVIYKHLHGYMIQSGGVWVPKNTQEKIKLFGYAHQDIENFTDLNAALAAQRSGASSASALQSQEAPATGTVVQMAGTSGASPAQAGAAGGIAGGIVSAAIAADIEKERGMPLPLATIENADLKQLILRSTAR
jgi:hypothetical protein